MTFTAGEDPTAWITGLITEKVEDEAVVDGVSEGLEGVGNRIPTTDPGKEKENFKSPLTISRLPKYTFLFEQMILRD